MIMVEYDSHNAHRPTHHHSHSYSHSQSSVRGSPLPQHLEQHPSARSTPSPTFRYAPLPMQQQQQQQAPAPARSTPTSYPSPSYPSPSISTYQYPPQPGPRGSPYSQPQQLPPFNLPPIRLNPPATSQSLPPPSQAPLGSPLMSSMGSPLPQPSPQPIFYPLQHGGLPPPALTHPSHITSSPNQPVRYPLPSIGSTERIMSGGRHKKEIKRRTKTGCLTCRKRRIKCDEAHPSCKNCAKSKRDCLGYDPIFKAQPGPAAIQPAPSTGSHPRLIASAYSMSYLGGLSVGGQSYSQTISTGSSPASSSCETYDYQSIDPSLDASVNPQIPMTATIMEPQTYRPELKRRLDRGSPFSSASDATRATPIPRSSTPGQSKFQDNQGGNAAKRIKIDDLLSVSSSSQPLTPPSSEAASYASPSTSVEGMKQLYRLRFAPGLDSFLETAWFGKSGLSKILGDVPLLEVMAEVFERLKARSGMYVAEEDPAIRRKGKHSNLLWAAIKMCYGTSIPASDNTQDEEDSSKDDEGAETLRRIQIVEALLTFQYLEKAPVPSDDSESNAAMFWNLLGRVVAAKGDDAESIKGILEECGRYIDGKENRKLLYNIAEYRHVKSRRYKPAEPSSISEDSKILSDKLKMHIESVTNAPREASLNRRIAARAELLWMEGIKETPLYC